jgi:enoyl-CoA hydratase/carnithine racemase
MPLAESKYVTETKKDNVLYITLNRPDKLNALIDPMRDGLLKIVQTLMNRDDVRACVITGAGRAFCAGGDINVMEDIIASQNYDRIQTILMRAQAIVLALRALPIPVIGAVNGHAFGSGMNLALACDIRLVSTKATFGQTFINIGLHPDWGGTYFLPGIINASRALDMFWTGRVITAEEAMHLGIANKVIPHDQFLEKVHSYALNLSNKSKLVIKLVKKGVYDSMNKSLEDMLSHEMVAQGDCIRTEEAKMKIQAFTRKR